MPTKKPVRRRKVAPKRPLKGETTGNLVRELLQRPAPTDQSTMKPPATLVEHAKYYAKFDHVGSMEQRARLSHAADLMREVIKKVYGRYAPPGMEETPERFVAYLQEYNQQHGSFRSILGEGFERLNGTGIHGLIAQDKIPFKMICEHHLLPAWGHAAIGYIPHKRIVGLSKMARLVEAAGVYRPTVQEELCETIAAHMESQLEARGVIVLLQAEHSCMACRGVNTPGVKTSTSCVRGVLRDVPAAREEFFSMIRG